MKNCCDLRHLYWTINTGSGKERRTIKIKYHIYIISHIASFCLRKKLFAINKHFRTRPKKKMPHCRFKYFLCRNVLPSPLLPRNIINKTKSFVSRINMVNSFLKILEFLSSIVPFEI